MHLSQMNMNNIYGGQKLAVLIGYTVRPPNFLGTKPIFKNCFASSRAPLGQEREKVGRWGEQHPGCRGNHNSLVRLNRQVLYKP